MRWKIESIREADYGCEERMPGDKLRCFVTLVDECGKKRYLDVLDEWLIDNNIDEGQRWYDFYGWEKADMKPVNEFYNKINNPKMLYDILADIWCADTCAPRLRDGWSKENMTLGQCSITSFLVQDIFGGKVYGILRSGGNYHCYNVIRDCVFDLTSEQFKNEKLSYIDNKEQFREDHFCKDEKRLRYEYLKSQIDKFCSGK